MRNTSNWLETTSLEIATSISTDPATAPPKVNFQCKSKFEAKVMIWMGMSSKGACDIYVHKSKQAVNQETYLKEYIDKRLLPFIVKYHSNENSLIWPDLAKAHYSNIVQQCLTRKKSAICFSCWQFTKCSSSSSNWNCMDCTWTKDIWKQLGSKKYWSFD